MPREKVGHVPEFTDPATPEGEKGAEEVKKAPPESAEEKEKETPAEPPAAKEPAEEPEGDPEGEPAGEGVDTGDVVELKKQVQGLANERDKILLELQGLRGKRRELKKDKLVEVEKELDELKDINPADVKVIERIMKSRGYASKDEVNKLIYSQVQKTELNKFLDTHPQYKPENDPNDLNWNAFQKELGDYKLPKNPQEIGRILKKVHKAIAKPSSEPTSQATKKRLEIAGVGTGGATRSSVRKTLPSWMKDELSRGGFSEEEIKEAEKNYTPKE